MAKAPQQKPRNRFNRGLITEAGELTFPDDASVDELNCTLLRDGSRRRRLGIEYETGYTTDAGATLTDGAISSVHIWKNAGGEPETTFVVVQLGGTLHFYTEGSVVSTGKKSFTQNLTTYDRPTGSGAAAAEVQTAVIQGRLVVASPEINTFYIEYDPDGDSISATEISFRVRDFEWQGTRDDYYTESPSSTVSVARDYDTKNAGWDEDNNGRTGTALDYYKSQVSNKYPALTHPWFSGKDSSNQQSVPEFKKIAGGTSLSGVGRYTYDLYSIDRQTAASLSDSSLNYTETSRFKTVASFAGRVWYAGMENDNTSKVYFSQVIDDISDIGELLQVNDPTNEYFSDLLDNDGGFVQIPDAYNIKKLHVLGTSLIVFAENGVWSIKGVDNVFRATGYAINKISDAGLAYDGSFVAQEGSRPYWWSSIGIYTLELSVEQNSLKAVNISLTTIQTLFDNIDPSKRAQVASAYDGFNNRVAWFYPDDDESVDYKMSKILWFDEILKAFYPWEISESSTSIYAVKPFFLEGAASADVTFNVVDANEDQVIDGSSDTVVVTRTGRNFLSSSLVVLVRTDVATDRVTFAKFTNIEFVDWGAADYSSYAEGGYDFLGDLTMKKSTMYITVLCKITEDTVVSDGAGGFEYTRPSSCKISTFWDYATTASQTAQEAYRLKNLATPTEAGPFVYPRTVTTSRLRLRGRGRSLRVRFESTSGYDFHLLGYDSISMGNRRP